MDSTNTSKTKRYFAIDIDKTFYIEDSNKFGKNVESFNDLKSKSIVPFFCTGRVLSSAMRLVGEGFTKQTGYKGYPGVYANGAIVYDNDGNIISHKYFPKGFMEKFLKYIRENDLEDATIFGEEERFYILKELNEDFKDYPKKKNLKYVDIITPEELADKKIISINVNKEVEIDELRDNFTTKVCANDRTYHISPKSVTKAFGVKKLLNHLGHSPDQCLFIGNGNNDIELLEFCKVSYAVGNANDEVKKAAKTVLEENYDQCAFKKVVELITAS